MAGTTAGAELMISTVVVEIKYFCTKNVVIHTENCKLNLPLDCSTTHMEKNIRRMCGIDESSRWRGFADFALKVFYIDFIEAGCSRKAPFVIRTKDQWEMFQKSSCTSLSVRVSQREVTFQKGSVNIVLRQNSLSLPKTDDPQPSTSSQIQPQQESAKSKTCITLGFFPDSASGNGIWALGSGISKKNGLGNGTGTPPPTTTFSGPSQS